MVDATNTQFALGDAVRLVKDIGYYPAGSSVESFLSKGTEGTVSNLFIFPLSDKAGEDKQQAVVLFHNPETNQVYTLNLDNVEKID